MFILSKEMIRHAAIDDITYVKGMQYYKKGAVSNVTYSKATCMYRAIVTGKNKYSVIIDVNNERYVRYTCNCPAKIKKTGACKHVVATLFYLEHYYLQAKESKIDNNSQKSASRIINYFRELSVPVIKDEEFSLKASIRFPEILSDAGNERAYLSLYVGISHLYKIQNLKKFLADYLKGNTIKLGKDFYFVPGENRFNKGSKSLLQYILGIYEVHYCFGTVSNSDLFNKGELSLTLHMLKKLLPLIGKNYFLLNLYGNEYKNVQYEEGNPKVVFKIQAENQSLIMDFEEDHPVTVMAKDGSILFSEEKIFLPEDNFIINYLPFYNCLGSGREPLLFEGTRRFDFFKIVFPKLSETMKLRLPPELEEKYIEEPLEINFYLDRDNLFITGRAEFCYGRCSINPLDEDESSGYIVLRNQEMEEKFISELYNCHFVKYYSLFAIKDEEEIYNFLCSDIKSLTSMCRVYYSDDFKKLRYENPGKFKSEVRYHMDTSFFDVEMGYENIPKEDLEELFRSIRIRKKYHRLKDGRFLDLTTDDMKFPIRLMEQLNLNLSRLSDNHFNLPVYGAVSLNYHLKEYGDGTNTGDSYYNGLINDLESKDRKIYKIPEEITANVRDYQITGFSWLCMLADYGFGGILADDMGLGKTLQSICFLVKAAKENRGVSLIVCPTSLIYNWQYETEKFAPGLKTLLITGTPEERERLIKGYAKADVIITSYPSLRKDIQYYEDIDFYSMFLDEAQFIKNPKSINAKTTKSIKAAHRFALTGTPIENSLTELWSIFDYIMPKYLYGHVKFSSYYERPIIKLEDAGRIRELNIKIRPFILRRMKKNVLSELPDKTETRLLSEMTNEQRLIYQTFLKKARLELDEDDNENNRIKMLTALMRLRQICCHPLTFASHYKGKSGKLEQLMEIVENTMESGHRILIFSQFTTMLKIIGIKLKSKEIPYFYLDGETPPSLRTEYANRFNEGENSVFLISLKAGGTGLNLTGADTVIHYDPWWNPAVEDQATDRAYRIGQEHKVQVIKLIAKNSVEEKILKLKELKKNLSDSVVTADEVFIDSLTKEELKELFSD